MLPMSKKTYGFTLIELLVVIAIIALLSSVVLAALSSARMKSRDARRKSDLQNIRIALELYYDAYGVYPPYRPSNTCVTPGRVDYSTSRCSTANWLTTDANFLKYIPIVPRDPVNDGAPSSGNDSPWWGAHSYAYTTSASGTNFDLVAELENSSDVDRCEIRKYLATIDHDGASPDNGTTAMCNATIGVAPWTLGYPQLLYYVK